MKEPLKKRVKSTVFWGALASAILLFVQNILMLLGIELPAEVVAGVMTSVNSLLSILTLSGLLVNPKEVDSFQAMVKKSEPIKLMVFKKQ